MPSLTWSLGCSQDRAHLLVTIRTPNSHGLVRMYVLQTYLIVGISYSYSYDRTEYEVTHAFYLIIFSGRSCLLHEK